MFAGCGTPQEIKSLFRTLAFQNHPDRGGSNEAMKAINAAYHKALKGLHGFTSKGTDGKNHTYYYHRKAEQAVMDKVQELLGLNLTECSIEIIGTWVWVSGETKQHQAKLNSAKCRWHGKRGRWYWHTPSAYRRKYSHASMETLRRSYGVAGRWDVTEEKRASLPAGA